VKTWLPWVLVLAVAVLLLEERWAGRVAARIEAREDTLESGRERIRRARLAKDRAREPIATLRRRYRTFNVDSVLASPDTVVCVPREQVATSHALIRADSVALEADDSLDAAQTDHIAVEDRQVADLRRLVRPPLLSASAGVFARLDPTVRFEAELAVRGIPLIVRGVLEADTAGMQRRLEVGVRKTFRLF
jgi:hypothetical protein